MEKRALYLFALVIFGLVWGITIPLFKITVEAGYPMLGLLFWQVFFTGLTLIILLLPRLRWRKLTAPRVRMFVTIALTGSILPMATSYFAADNLPAGVMAIIISTVPMFALAIAVAIKNEEFTWMKFSGVICGMIAVILLIGPDTSLPEGAKIGFVFLAMIAPFCYGVEDNTVARFGLFDLTPVEMLLGAMVVANLVVAPVTLLSGDFIPLWRIEWGLAEWAILFIGLLHATAYSGYIWLVKSAGAVFAAQVAYLVTGFGVLWSIILLNESYSGWVWSALLVMLVGLVLVRPKEPI